MKSSDSSYSNAKPSTQSNHCLPTRPPNCPPSHRANNVDSHDTTSSDSEDPVLDDADVHANVTELPDSSCTINTLNKDKFFICTSAMIISPSVDSSTHYVDALADGALVSLPVTVKTLLDSGCTAHIFKEKKNFWSYCKDKAVDVKTANCDVLSTMACGEIHIQVHCSNGKHVVVCLLDCLHVPDVPMNLISVGALMGKKNSAW